MISLHKFTFNHFQENTYLIWDEDGTAAVIDPGCFFPKEKQRLAAYIADNKLTLKHLLYTHCHLDHAFGAHWVAQSFPGISIAGHPEDEIFLKNYDAHAQRFGISMEQPPLMTAYLSGGSTFQLGKETVSLIQVPGHSAGSICFYSQSSEWVIVGDVLFAGSVGRSDLPGGNHPQLIAGIKEKLFSLPAQTTVYSGHGDESTIGTEIKTNPFTR